MNFQSISTFILAASLVDATIHTKISPSGRWIGVYNDEVDAREREPYRWIDAENYCQSTYGTSLASYHNSKDELEVSRTRVLYSQQAWIGLNDRRSESGIGNGGIRDGWTWSDGSCYNFEINWNTNEPNNGGHDPSSNSNGEDFAHLIGFSDHLNDDGRSHRLDSFICNYMAFEVSSVDNIVVNSVNGMFELSSDEADDYCNEFFGSDLEEISSTSGGEGGTQIECGPKYCRRRNAATAAPTPEPTNAPTCETYAEILSNVGRNEFYRYWSSSYKDHFYTTNYNELGSGSSSYKLEGNVGYLWDSEIENVTVELYRYYANCNGLNHFYTSNYNELGDGAMGYQKEGSPGYIMTVDCSDYNNFNQPLYRYYSGSICDHFYTTNYNELKDGSGTSYKYEGIAGYVATSDIDTVASDDDSDFNEVILNMVDNSNNEDESYSFSNDTYLYIFIGGIVFSCLLLVIYQQFCNNNNTRIKSILFSNNDGYQTV